jgi:E3 ubiquitin-protein ligase NEDD4
VEDWKAHTEYKGYVATDEVIQLFWKVCFLASTRLSVQCVKSFDNEKRARLLQFVTGTSRIPVNGFKDLHGSDGPRRFCIERAGVPAQLPKSHTWYFGKLVSE